MSWDLYYNLEGNELVRANLVYTPYVSADKTTFCMEFQRNPLYHNDPAENAQWSEEDLEQRFLREIQFHSRASSVMPTLDLKDVDYQKRKIFFNWHGNDFYMQGLVAGGYDNVLPNWQEQWQNLIKKMWSIDLIKISLHPNSWVAHNGVLIPFNWFYSYDSNEYTTIRGMLKQISSSRQEKMFPLLKEYGLDIDTEYSIKKLQPIAFNSFRSNYPAELINTIINYTNDIL
jgi:hypothetical protein